MTPDPLILAAVFLAGLVLGWQQTLLHAADAAIRFERRAWWRRAIFKAEQRAAYQEFSRQVDEEQAGERQDRQQAREQARERRRRGAGAGEAEEHDS